LDLRRALSGLPTLVEPRDFSMARVAVRGAMLVVATGAYVVFCFTLLLVFALALLIYGASGSLLVTFLLVWGVPTYLLTRLWRRAPSRLRR
jgi:hypothetical protein